MAHSRLFRFGVQGRGVGPRDQWLQMIRRVEDEGYSSYVVLDHFVRGLDPVAALGAAALATSSLRLGTMVVDNDFRHPVVLAKAMATIDVLSNGRLEIGLGAGWLREEYEQAGIPFDTPGIRIERMIETVQFMKRVFVEDRVTFAGMYLSTTNLILTPKPVQQPCPPLLIGGRRILSVAGRYADIVAFTSRSLPDGSKQPADMTAAAVIEKIRWVREAAGDRFPDLEMTSFASEILITDDRLSAADRLADHMNLTREEILDSPHLLVGSLDQMEEDLRRRRERFGISYYVVEEINAVKFAPLVARLTGT